MATRQAAAPPENKPAIAAARRISESGADISTECEMTRCITQYPTLRNTETISNVLHA